MQSDHGDIACPVIVVGGTNGKGSTVAFIEPIYQTAGYRSVVYTSPHITRYNERIRIAGINVSDAQLIGAFAKVEDARAGISLSYFEFGTLAALSIAAIELPDVLILEVGLGGRLDAVNILHHDVAIITNIALDHMEWLGDNLQDIAIEKAGIARQGRPLIIADADTPSSLYDHASKLGAEQIRMNRDMKLDTNGTSWAYHCGLAHYTNLPLPGIAGVHQLNNAAAAICAVDCLQHKLTVNESSIKSAIANSRLPGRFEKVSDQPVVYLDVAHNPAAFTHLFEKIKKEYRGKKVHVLLGMAKDKDIEGSL
ncbi:MAG: bifunctional folylpolyglutamate synthase/dihydrofolate synthase, partial [Deltaproteobacteria bacterium]